MDILQNRNFIHAIGGALLKAFITICIAALSGMAFANAPAPDRSTSRYEIGFMQEMIGHHMMAVDMGKMCLEKAVHQELRGMCQDIVTSQQQEIHTMQEWLATWYGIPNYQPQMNPGQEQQMEKLAMLNNAEFEIEFMKQMIRHHKTAVVNASQCVERVYHPELEDMCENIITAQLREIRQMKDWLCVWYGMCRPRHRH